MTQLAYECGKISFKCFLLIILVTVHVGCSLQNIWGHRAIICGQKQLCFEDIYLTCLLSAHATLTVYLAHDTMCDFLLIKGRKPSEKVWSKICNFVKSPPQLCSKIVIKRNKRISNFRCRCFWKSVFLLSLRQLNQYSIVNRWNYAFPGLKVM